MNIAVPLRLLGQSGYRLEYPGCVIYVDPYLSNSVQEMDAPDLERLVPIAVQPDHVLDADWVLITHDHIDHCDPHTLPQLSAASPGCRFMGPPPVLERLREWGITPDRLRPALEAWGELGPDLRVHALPAAHPTPRRDQNGNSLCVGYLLEHAGSRLYLAGDTSVTQELLDALKKHTPICTAILPVNEHNFFRARRGIVGNMSIREAFLLAEELGIDHVVPVHWDMFAVNAVDPEEIRAVYRQMRPRFQLLLQPQTLPMEGQCRSASSSVP